MCQGENTAQTPGKNNFFSSRPTHKKNNRVKGETWPYKTADGYSCNHAEWADPHPSTILIGTKLWFLFSLSWVPDMGMKPQLTKPIIIIIADNYEKER